MRLKEPWTRFRQLATSRPLAIERDKHRAAILYFLLLLLLVSFTILIIIPVKHKLTHVSYALFAADAILLLSLILTRAGNITFASYLVPLGLLAVNTYIIFYGQGIHDITILGLPVIIALGGLLLGKRGALALASLCILCLGGVAWAEINGLTPNTGIFTSYISIDNISTMAVLLGTTAALIYFTSGSLSRSLEATRLSENALREANQELERYAEILEQRTAQLLTGAKVSRVASSILEPDELCQQVVDVVHARFKLYYVGLFMVDKECKWANLYAGTGKAGKAMLKEGHRLKVGNTSMIGWCIAHRKARIALDVGIEAVRFDNPLLPETRSELALPLISRGQVIGALGIQSSQEAAFSEEDITSFQAMADQLANAISNARLYDQVQRELAERKRVEKKIRRLNTELERRVAERTRELQAANENLTTLSRLKDEFLANVSHELRTPLTSIKLYHDMLERQPQDLVHYMDHLKRETERLAHLIEDLLYLSRLDQGYAPFDPVSLDLNRLAQEYVTDRIPLAVERRLILKLEECDPLPHALADEQMTGQVLSAILTNALNYTPSGGVVIIRTSAQEQAGKTWAGFTVSDTGPGISAEDREHLFERFYRGETGRVSATPGTGLGLSIAKEIVQRHGGRIEVKSAGVPGKGTTFSVWLPVATDHFPDYLQRN
jgi:signal transduction histidine kinase